MKKWIITFLCLIASCIMLCSCGESKYVGEWYNSEYFDVPSTSLTKDGTYVKENGEGGTWSLEDNKILLVPQTSFSDAEVLTISTYNGEECLIDEIGAMYFKDYDVACKVHDELEAEAAAEREAKAQAEAEAAEKAKKEAYNTIINNYVGTYKLGGEALKLKTDGTYNWTYEPMNLGEYGTYKINKDDIEEAADEGLKIVFYMKGETGGEESGKSFSENGFGETDNRIRIGNSGNLEVYISHTYQSLEKI